MDHEAHLAAVAALLVVCGRASHGRKRAPKRSRPCRSRARITASGSGQALAAAGSAIGWTRRASRSDLFLSGQSKN
jgi:hypothetical protein